jgi:hypothetical protein
MKDERMAEGKEMEHGFVQVRVYATKENERLVELPDGAVGIINGSGDWVYGPLPVKWSKVMLKNTLTEWTNICWTQSGIEFMAAAA